MPGGDNNTIRVLLITTFVSEATEIVMVQPIELLIFAGLLPAMAAFLLLPDVRKFMVQEGREARRIREAEIAHEVQIKEDMSSLLRYQNNGPRLKQMLHLIRSVMAVLEHGRCITN